MADVAMTWSRDTIPGCAVARVPKRIAEPSQARHFSLLRTLLQAHAILYIRWEGSRVSHNRVTVNMLEARPRVWCQSLSLEAPEVGRTSAERDGATWTFVPAFLTSDPVQVEPWNITYISYIMYS